MKTSINQLGGTNQAIDINRVRSNARPGSLWVCNQTDQYSERALVFMLVPVGQHFALVAFTAAPHLVASDIRNLANGHGHQLVDTSTLKTMWPWYGTITITQTQE